MIPSRIVVFLGARPNVPKAWTLLRALHALSEDRETPVTVTVVHSGQHYHEKLGEKFAEQLGIRVDVNLETSSGDSDADQLGLLMSKCESVLQDLCPDCVVVIGDVNTTLAAAIVASRRGLSVVHVEAGLRLGRRDPEETNRKVITACSDYHLATSRQSVDNLLSEGVERRTVFFVGNTMAETFLMHKSSRQSSTILHDLNLEEKEYILFTVHKAVNLTRIDWVVRFLSVLATTRRIVFPCHPHTRKLLEQSHKEVFSFDNLMILEPLSYGDLGRLMEDCYCVITDSAGLQEESTVAHVPCITVGFGTARPETVVYGSNTVIAYDIAQCMRLIQGPLEGGCLPDRWDSLVSQRIRDAFAIILRDIASVEKTEQWNLRPCDKVGTRGAVHAS